MFTLSVFIFFFISDLFQFRCPFHAYFHPYFYVVLFNSFFTLFSLFPLFHQSVFFTSCVSSHCVCLSLSHASPSSSSLVPTHRSNQQPSILVVLSYTNRSVNTAGSEELKSLIHEIKTTFFFLFCSLPSMPAVQHTLAAETCSRCRMCPHSSRQFRSLSFLTLLSSKCLFPLIYTIQTRKFRMNAISRDF